MQLTGKELLKKVQELSRLPRRETARECGYVTTAKSGQTRVNLTGFYNALLAAKGVDVESNKPKRGKEVSYRVSVHQNGQIVIGSSYTQEMGFKPGDEFEIKLGYKHLKLIAIEQSVVEESKLQTA